MSAATVQALVTIADVQGAALMDRIPQKNTGEENEEG